MAVRVVLKGETIAQQMRRNMDATAKDIAVATTKGAKDAALAIVAQGRQDIASAGRFGRRWIDGLKAEVEPKSGALINAKITVTHDVPYFDVFETGKTIHGNPMMWIPLSYTGLTMSAGTYAKVFGGLFSVQRTAGGAPLLFSTVDKKAKYFGVSRVNIPKKFHITEICRDTMAKFDMYYSRNLSGK